MAAPLLIQQTSHGAGVTCPGAGTATSATNPAPGIRQTREALWRCLLMHAGGSARDRARPALGDLGDYAGACFDDEALLRDDAAAHRPRFCSAIADAQD
jgi:hypothetical protein